MEKHRRRHFIKRCFLTAPVMLFMTAFLPFSISPNAAAANRSSAEVRELIPVGHTVGVKLFSDGVMVVGVSMVETETGKISPAAEAGIMEGDIITHIGNTKVSTNEQVQKAVQNADSEITVRIRRQGKPMQVNITPVRCIDGSCYMLGIWIRDSMAGIGTLTFYDPETKVFGALGHGISDVDTLELMPLSSGSIMYSTVKSIQKGVAGTPGELKGDFNLIKDAGVLYSNSDCGIFGKLNDLSLVKEAKAVPVASKRVIMIV
jgi:stage IV sporulation protein B